MHHHVLHVRAPLADVVLQPAGQLVGGGQRHVGRDGNGDEDDEAAESILRGIERLGSDPSIAHYEMTRVENRRSYRGAQRTSWSVRAVRP